MTLLLADESEASPDRLFQLLQSAQVAGAVCRVQLQSAGRALQQGVLIENS